MTQLRLLLGDQLNPCHPWFDRVDPQVVYVMMEVRQETDYVLHHAQKVIAIFAAMRHFTAWLQARGHRVAYMRIGDDDNRQSLPDNLSQLIHRFQAVSLAVQPADEWRLDRQLAEYLDRVAIPTDVVDSAHFLATRAEVQDFFGTRRRWTMEHFYRHMRVRHGVLLESDGTPCGGRWNFDADNRQPWRAQPPEPVDPRPRHDHRDLWREIQAAGVETFGDPRAENFRWPLHRDEALQQLEAFVAYALPHFGAYQDAMSRHASRLFHSQLSFALNVKMLSPAEVLARVESAWRQGHAPLAAAEGFIRQILGWREYVRGVYWARMPDYATHNTLGHDRPLPGWFWTGETRMQCLRHAIGQSLAAAHAHHIQRLMVIGNFALLAGLDPHALHRWYLGVYIDAFEWVELPNTLGMSQFADGGLLATKPYASSAAYLHRMGDYCTGCPYRREQRTGPRACPFNALYWDFLARNAGQLARNPRMAMPYRQLARMPEQAILAIRAHAAHLKASLAML